ncbi:HTH domain-containing protein [Brucella pseudogrignonensis]|uniref:HTH domain-containing protein n=1 Tax=Brucella pseudogrignonensis TaxID=419475 RepID=UPI003B9EB9E1
MMPSPEGYVSESAARRSDRRSAIIETMQSRTLTKAYELASLLKATNRTIYRDIAALRQAGHQIVGEAGVGYIFKGPKQ